MKRTPVTRATLGRIPVYLQYLKGLSPDAGKYISSTAISRALGFGEVQVRKDLNSVSGAGRPKVGYVVADLVVRLESFLGRNAKCKAVIVGAGRLGMALLDYGGFENYGLEVSAGFDVDPEKFGVSSSGKEILPAERFEEYCRRESVRIGIVTVPAALAQKVCDMMVGCGITAVWNFAPCTLSVPDGVILRQENLALSLAHLKNQMEECSEENQNRAAL